MMNFDFYASIGDVETHTMWRRPDMMRFSDWWKEWSYLTPVDDYDIFLTGGFAEQKWGVYSGLTWDVDIVILGEVRDTKGLKSILDEGYRIGFKHQLCMDMIWSSNLFCCMNDEFVPYSWIRNSPTFTKHHYGEITQTNFISNADDYVLLPDGLVQLLWYEPSKCWNKVQRRRENGEYLGTILNLKEFFG
jgi:hypothetical protein